MHAQRGSTMVEFALSAGVMLLLIFGIMECALEVYAYHTISTAARLGTRWAMVRGSDCPAPACPAGATDVSNYVLTQVPLLDTSKVTVATTWSNTADCAAATKNAAGCTVAVTVSYPFNLALPFIWKSAPTLSSTSEVVISE